MMTLEEFSAEESALDFRETILPNARPSNSVFDEFTELKDIPRAVTSLTPEAIKRFGVRDFGDLERVSAGTQLANFYGIPGTPYIRGDLGSIYFNGMLRAYQRNEAPTSFGSLEGLDIVKGAAPGHFGPSQAGGYINFIPKSPFFDESRGNFRFTYGSFGSFNVQFDYGGPVEVLGRPAAYRASFTGQLADSFYDRIENNFISIYASVKSEIFKDVTLFSGMEFYLFRSNENAGFNRVTQDLIDNGNYIVGEPTLLTSDFANGLVAKQDSPFVISGGLVFDDPAASTVTAFGGGNFVAENGPLPAGTLISALIPSAGFVATQSGAAQAALGPNGEYTPGYFAAGGQVETVNIEGSTVLADDADFADSEDFIWFLDLVSERNPDMKLTSKTFVEYFDSNKLSSYGYAFLTEQLVFEQKVFASFELEDFMPFESVHKITGGFSFRASDVLQLQDFDAEPFSRRDISAPIITQNSRVITGAQLNSNGTNNWSQFNSANVESQLFQYSGFLYVTSEWTNWLTTVVSARGEVAAFEADQPVEPDFADPVNGGSVDPLVGFDGQKTYGNFSGSVIVEPIEPVSVYATVVQGTALTPTQGGAINIGEGNFNELELYEAGIKVELFDKKLFGSVAGYYWDRAQFNDIAGALDQIRAKGFEAELTWVPIEGLSISSAFNMQRQNLRSGLPFRFWNAGDANVPLVSGGLFAAGGDPFGIVAQNNPDQVIPGTPEITANLFIIYQHPSGFGGGFGPQWRDGYAHNFENTLRIPSSLVWNAIAFYEHKRFSVQVEFLNIGSEDYFLGSDPFFAANTIITKAPDFEVQVSASFNF
ncbi:MAG: TonB-dependent receptor plug domain-containing protein [Opitutales bacterium]